LTLLLWSVCSSWWIYPHSLSYFNESIGGPRSGAGHLLGSNLGWRQDLRYFEANGDAPPRALDLTTHYSPISLGVTGTVIGHYSLRELQAKHQVRELMVSMTCIAAYGTKGAAARVREALADDFTDEVTPVTYALCIVRLQF